MQSKTNDWYAQQLDKPGRHRAATPYRASSVQRELNRRQVTEGWARLVGTTLGLAGVMVSAVWAFNWARHL